MPLWYVACYVPSMPQNPRVHVTFRIAPGGFDWLGQVAHEEGVDRSTVMRLSVALAKKYETELRQLIKDRT